MGYRPGSYAVTYPVVTVHAERKGRCPLCHRRVTRRMTFENTVNPFNRTPDGHVRTREEVRAKLREEAARWQADFTHETCRVLARTQEIT